MQNEPNLPSTIEYQESCIENMQNKPNSTNPGYKLKAPPKGAQLNNQLSILTVPCAPGINGKANPITIGIGGIRYARPLTCSTVHLLYFLALGAANPIYLQQSSIKDRASRICKTNPIYQYAIRHTQYDIREYLCKTNPIYLQQSNIKNRASRICKTNPIQQTQVIN